MSDVINEFSFYVKFSEVDSMRVVWHGHYIRYFEDGREAFGREFALTYMDFVNEGFMVPLVSVQCDYKRSLEYGEQVLVKTHLVPFEGAKLKFRYELFKEDGRLAAVGTSDQVFLNLSGDLNLTLPDMMRTFYQKHEISF